MIANTEPYADISVLCVFNFYNLGAVLTHAAFPNIHSGRSNGVNQTPDNSAGIEHQEGYKTAK